MKIIKFKAGLGNQMFQYAFMRKLSIILPEETIKSDIFYQTSINNFNLNLNPTSEKDLENICIFKHKRPYERKISQKFKIIGEGIFNNKYFFETQRIFYNLDKIIKYNYYDGYWQTEKYFKDIRNILLKEFTLKTQYIPKIEMIRSQVQNENSVFIGIRRGDYLADKNTTKHFGVIKNTYYLDAIQYIKGNTLNPVFYVFSDDIEWVKENMEFNCKVHFRDRENLLTDIEELMIMASCKHAIIPNSTFHWWGAWLIKDANKIVIAPEGWFADGTKTDIIPEEWIQMKAFAK